MNKYIIKDWTGIKMYDKLFNSYEDAWDYLYTKFPVTYNKDGSQNDREEELDEFWVEQMEK